MADIIQWNCRSLRSNAENLKVLMNRSNPSVVCLQETKLGEKDFNPGLNFSFYKSPSPSSDHAKGGTAIIVNNALHHSYINLNTSLQAVAVSIVLDKVITVCSIYLPDRVTLCELQNLINQLPAPFLLLGDFNAHNPLWGGENLDCKGETIEELIDNNPISIFNDGTFTYHNIYSGSKSAIDLSICSSNIFIDFTWWVDDYLNGSDHFPIYLKASKNSPSSASPKWKLNEADWAEYSNDINLDREFESFQSHIEAYDYLVEKMLSSGNANIPKTKALPRRPAVPWWNTTCSKLRRTTRKFYRQYKNSRTPEAKATYQRAVAKQRNYFKKVKRDSWICYINGINSQTAVREVWKKVRKLCGRYVPSPLPHLKVGNKLITDNEEVANKLGEHFSNISSPKRELVKKNQKKIDITINLNSGKDESYNIRFSYKELVNALDSAESSAPGEDSIVYEMVRHLPEHAKIFFLKILNKIWETGILPKSWKISLIVPVKKPNKNATSASSYRPIALTSCLCKVMEKMINTRLVWYLEKNNLISPFQYGFRKNRSTLDPLFRLSNQIQQGFAQQKQTIAVFFDLEKAYDTTWRQGIISELCELGIKGNMLKFLRSFLTDRYLKVKVGHKISHAFHQEEGVPQGSILSVALFVIAINKITNNISSPVKCSLFADDLAIFCTSYDALSACRHLQTAINSISKWADDHGFRFSPQKTVAVRFATSRKSEEIPVLKLKDNILPYEDQVKFLGVIFDKKLNWGPHIKNLKEEVRKSLNILKVVSSYDWGADRNCLLKLYNSLCKSKIDYACQIYSSACKTRLEELDPVHNLGLRLCTGAFRTSPKESLYVDSHELPLDLRREELGLRYMTRIKSAPQNPSFMILGSCNMNLFKNSQSSKPFDVRLNEQVEDTSLKRQKIAEVGYPNFPPWLFPKMNVCPKLLVKKNVTSEECKAKFLEHDHLNHSDHVKVFTDGSKSCNGVGCAVYIDSTTYQAKLSPMASVFTAELTAITEALALISERQEKEFVIYTDSYSSILALQHFNSFNPLVRKAQEWLFKLHSKFKIYFCWIPSHVGILQNEEVDRAARHASSASELNITRSRIPHCDMKKPIRDYIWNKWQKKWMSPDLKNNRKYRKIRPCVNPWLSSSQSNRRTERNLCRLRIGHSRLTHSFRFERTSPPMCDHCQVQLTIEHILVDCTAFVEKRRIYHLDGKSLDILLGDDINVQDIMNFLKDINLYFKL